MNQEIKKPKIFIGSSTEGLDISYAIQENLEHEAEVTVWDQGVFEPSNYNLESLLECVQNSDFGIFVFSADDIIVIRDVEKKTARDNVVFELGLFIGWLGRDRCFIVKPREEKDLHLPTDLLGIKPLDFSTNREDKNLKASLGPACNNVRNVIRKLGIVTTDVSDEDIDIVASNYDENDIKAILTSWMHSLSTEQIISAINYVYVDKRLGFESGTTKKYIILIATTMNLEVQHEGENTILFKRKPLKVETKPSRFSNRY